MSYCVNCGVELAPSEQVCPLCDTPVVNPAAPWTAPRSMPYPRRVETIMHRVDRRYGAALGALALLIPALVTMLLDLLANARFNWSPYVVGALLLVFVCVLVPWLFPRPRWPLFIALDALALLLYLAYISGARAQFAWYLPLAVPLVLVAAALAYALLFAGSSPRLHGLYRPALMLGCLAAACVLAELCIDRYLSGVFRPFWSLMAAAPALVVAGMLLLIEKKQALKDEIRRRLFL